MSIKTNEVVVKNWEEKYTKNNFNFSTDFKYNENTYLKSKKTQWLK